MHTHEVLDALHDVMATLVNAETGQRGYIITGEAAYMEPYRAAAGALEGHLDRLQQLTADNPTQQRRLAALKETSGTRITTLAEGIAARDQGGPEAGRQFVLQGKGKQQMEANRVLIAEMNKTESDLLGVREAESRTSYRTALGTVLVTTLLGLGLVATAYGLSAREAGTRRRSAESLRRANDELEARVEERTADLASAVESGPTIRAKTAKWSPNVRLPFAITASVLKKFTSIAFSSFSSDCTAGRNMKARAWGWRSVEKSWSVTAARSPREASRSRARRF